MGNNQNGISNGADIYINNTGDSSLYLSAGVNGAAKFYCYSATANCTLFTTNASNLGLGANNATTDITISASTHIATFAKPVVVPGTLVEGTKFTSNAGCSETALVGGATAGSFTSGTTGTCTVTITMGGSATAPNGWACFANDLTTPSDTIKQTATSTTTATLSGTTVSGDAINFSCTGF
jgi:hypothetical protein